MVASTLDTLTVSVSVAAIEAYDIVGQRVRVQGDFGMGMRPEQGGALDADGLVAERGTLGGAGDDSDMLNHDQPLARGWAAR